MLKSLRSACAKRNSVYRLMIMDTFRCPYSVSQIPNQKVSQSINRCTGPWIYIKQHESNNGEVACLHIPTSSAYSHSLKN